MLELRPTEVYAHVQPKVKILLPDHWIRFSNEWPKVLDHVSGKTMRIAKTSQTIWPRTLIIKEGCYVDLNLSNDSGQELLYPNSGENLYEVLIGFHPGNFYIIPYFPASQPIWRLDEPTMLPTMSSATLKYLGIVRAEDSPVEDSILRFYFVYKLKPVILRVVADVGVDYEKCRLEFFINRCLMVPETAPGNVTPKPILYLDELKW